MKKNTIILLIVLLSLTIIIISIFLVVNKVHNVEETTNNFYQEINIKKSVLNDYERIKYEFGKATEEVLTENAQFPNIKESSKKLIELFGKDISKTKKVSLIFDNNFKREITRIELEDAQIDFDKNGEILAYKNFDDFSTVDKDKKNYNENEALPSYDYPITNNEQVLEIMKKYDVENELKDYELIDLSNISGSWIISWCKKLENGIINNYDTINVVVDASDGSIMLYGRNKIVPDSLEVIITQDEAINIANEVISDEEKETPNVKLSIFRPNFYFEEGGPYESADFVRLSWEISYKNQITVEVDTQTGEVLGGYKSNYLR